MTAQQSDTVIWKGQEHALAEAFGGPLFEPEAHGLRPVMIHTACWRGYLCTYRVEEALLLDTLTTRLEPEQMALAKGGQGPRIFDKAPRIEGEGHTLVYEALAAEIPFTGTLRIGRGFLEQLYVHAGFHPAHKYRDVHALRFEAGRLEGTEDLGAAMRDKRRALGLEVEEPRGLGAVIARALGLRPRGPKP